MYSRALVAFDRYDEEGSAIVAARSGRLAQAWDCELLFAFVRPQLPDAYYHRLPEGWAHEERLDCEKWLKRLALEHHLKDQVTGVFAPSGSVAEEITKLARKKSVDAILVGAHRMGLGRLILGSNTHAIIRDAPCDVIVIRAEDRSD